MFISIIFSTQPFVKLFYKHFKFYQMIPSKSVTYFNQTGYFYQISKNLWYFFQYFNQISKNNYLKMIKSNGIENV